MARRLDWTKPYMAVVGTMVRGIRYIQDGIDFNGAGEEVPPDPAVSNLKIEQAEGSAPDAKPDYSTWHHTKLRNEVMRRGGVYTNKDEAIAWLTEDDQ